MSDQPEDAENQAIDRLERALDRIATHIRDTDAPAPGLVGAESLSGAELRARLDQLVGRLRATLAAARADGN